MVFFKVFFFNERLCLFFCNSFFFFVMVFFRKFFFFARVTFFLQGFFFFRKAFYCKVFFCNVVFFRSGSDVASIGFREGLDMV